MGKNAQFIFFLTNEFNKNQCTVNPLEFIVSLDFLPPPPPFRLFHDFKLHFVKITVECVHIV